MLQTNCASDVKWASVPSNGCVLNLHFKFIIGYGNLPVFGHNPTLRGCLIMSPWCLDWQLWMAIFLVPRPVLHSECKIFNFQKLIPSQLVGFYAKVTFVYSIPSLNYIFHLLKWIKLKYPLTVSCYIQLLQTAALKEKKSCPYHNLFQIEFSTECDLLFPVSVSRFLSFP